MSGKTVGKEKKHVQLDEATRQSAWDELVRILIRGGTKTQAAELLGFHVKTIENWCKNPEFEIKLRRTRALVFQKTQDAGDKAADDVYRDVKAKLAEYALEAVEKARGLMHTAAREQVQLAAANSLMDRSPDTQKTKNVKMTAGVMVFSPENMAVALATAKEIRENVAIGKVVEAVALEPSMAEPILPDSPDLDDGSE